MSTQAELDKDFLISDVLIGDMLDVIYLANNQFVKSTDNFLDVVRLDYDIMMPRAVRGPDEATPDDIPISGLFPTTP